MQEQDLTAQANALLQQVSSSASLEGANGSGASEQTPDVIADIPRDQFVAALRQYTGGDWKDEQEFMARYKAADQVPTLSSKLRELEERAQQDPFASPFVKKLNELAANGADETALHRFVEFQRLNIDALDGKTAYAKQLLFEGKGYIDEEQAMALAEKKFAIDSENPDIALVAELNMLGGKAKEFLKSLKTEAENPVAVQQKIAQQQRMAAAEQAWGNVVQQMLYRKDEQGNQMPAFKDVVQHAYEDGEYKFEYNYDKQAIDAVYQHAIRHAVENGVELTMDGYNTIRSQVALLLRAIEGEKRDKALISDVLAKAKLQAVKSQSGPPPPPVRGAPPPPQPSAGNVLTAADLIRKGR